MPAPVWHGALNGHASQRRTAVRQGHPQSRLWSEASETIEAALLTSYFLRSHEESSKEVRAGGS
jgi:hypothetical protein